MSWMAAKMLEREQQLTFWWKRTKRQACLEIISIQNQRKSDWRNFSMHLPYLPNCSYGNSFISWMVSVSYTADFFKPYLGKYSILEATKQIFVLPLSIHTKNWKLIIITMANYFGLYLWLMSSALCLVSLWNVTYTCYTMLFLWHYSPVLTSTLKLVNGVCTSCLFFLQKPYVVYFLPDVIHGM